MFIPERNKNVISFRIPIIIFKGMSLLLVLVIISVGVLVYDYKQILGQVYENKHLTTINHKLKDKLNIFQIKISKINEDIQRIKIFEKKLRIITGVDHSLLNADESIIDDLNQVDENTPKTFQEKKIETLQRPYNVNISSQTSPELKSKDKDKEDKKNDYEKLKKLYHHQLVQDLGIPKDYKHNL